MQYRYHTITDVYTTALLLTKPSSDDSGFRHGFGAEASLPLTQSAPAVPHDTTRLCQIVVALPKMRKSLYEIIHYHYYHCYVFSSFSHQHYPMVSHWRLRDSKSPQICRTLLSILADLNNKVVWMVSSRLLISRPCTNPLVTEKQL